MKHYEECNKEDTSGRKGKNYAAASALYDLNGKCSVQTMHEKHDGIINLDEVEEKSVEGSGKGAGGAEAAKGGTKMVEEGLDEEDDLGLQDGLDGEEASISQQSGYSPKRGKVWFNYENGHGVKTGDDSSSVKSMTPDKATASAAGKSQVSSETGRSG